MSQSAPAIAIADLEVRAGKAQLLGPLSLTVEAGEHLLVVGRSGCGKTSLLRAIAGFAPTSAGRIELAGKLAQDGKRSVLQPQERGVGLLFQNGALWPHMKVAQTLRFVLKAGGVPKENQDSRCKKLLELVELAGYEKRSVPTLSGGEAQRLALARALALEPKLVLLDEPLGPLDMELRIGLLERLDALQKDLGLTLVHVTHDPEEVAHFATRRIRIDAGKIAGDERLQTAASQ